MRLRILSDIHLEVWPADLPAAEADVVVLAGDIGNGTDGLDWARRHFTGPMLYVPGNHEPYDRDFDSTLASLRDACRGSNIHLLECNEMQIGDVRFLGCSLWTDYSLSPEAERAATIEAARRMNPDHRAIRRGARAFSPEDAIALHATHRAWLGGMLARPHNGKTVVVTHFAPHPGSIAPAYAKHPANPGFIIDLTSMMGQADLWIHGHTHSHFDYVVRGTRIVCNARGYPEEPTGFVDDLVVTV